MRGRPCSRQFVGGLASQIFAQPARSESSRRAQIRPRRGGSPRPRQAGQWGPMDPRKRSHPDGSGSGPGSEPHHPPVRLHYRLLVPVKKVRVPTPYVLQWQWNLGSLVEAAAPPARAARQAAQRKPPPRCRASSPPPGNSLPPSAAGVAGAWAWQRGAACSGGRSARPRAGAVESASQLSHAAARRGAAPDSRDRSGPPPRPTRC